MSTEKIKIEDLLIHYLSEELTEDERSKVILWINEKMENRRYFEELKDIYEAGLLLKNNQIYDPDKSWHRVKAKYYKRKTEHFVRNNWKTSVDWHQRALRIAAIFIIAFILGIVTSTYFGKNQVVQDVNFNEVVAPLGSKTSINLADGTKVWLNAGSRLKYPVNFSQNSRDVYLEGEAYFNVAKQKSRKFIVHTSELNIKVLGTEFNVKAYPEEKTIETTLVRGSVTIERNKNNSTETFDPVYLEPNELAKFEKDDMSMEVTSTLTEPDKSKKTRETKEKLVVMQRIDPVIYTSWKDPRWIIQGEELQSLAKKLERRYDVKITIENETLKRYKFSGTLTDETLEQVLNIIKITAPIKYTIENKDVYFTEDKSSIKSYDQMLINR